MNKIISIVNQKGGVGKTTTAINLATALVSAGKKVLIIDSDPQGNISTSFGVEKSDSILTLYEVLLEEHHIDNVIMPTKIKNLDLVVANICLAAVEIELGGQSDARTRLKKKIQLSTKKYDHIIIDCPPSLGLLTINSLVASDSIIIPLQCEFLALEGLSHLLKTYKMIKAKLNTKLVINGIILTMYDKRNNLTSVIEDDVRNCLGKMVYKTVVPRNVKLSEAPSHGTPALIYDMRCPGSQAYISMAREFLQREKQEEEVL